MPARFEIMIKPVARVRDLGVLGARDVLPVASVAYVARDEDDAPAGYGAVSGLTAQAGTYWHVKELNGLPGYVRITDGGDTFVYQIGAYEKIELVASAGQTIETSQTDADA